MLNVTAIDAILSSAKRNYSAMNSQETTRAMLRAIANAASERWGENWQARLVSHYAALEVEETGNEKATPANRRNQIVRLFEEKGEPRLETFIRLCKCVDIEVELVIKREERMSLK